MIEYSFKTPYDETMKRSSFASIIRQSANDIFASLDMRPRQRAVAIRRGQTVQSAWTSTGAYIKGALEHYDQSSPRNNRAR